MVKNKEVKPKKTKSEPGPKKPLSAFFYYAQERRKTLKLEQPDLKITEVSKVIGVEWNKLSDDQKEPYQKSAMDDRSRYENEKIEMLKEKKKGSKKGVIVVESDEEDF